MKVLNITEEGRGGGPLKRIRNVARELAKYDIQTLVLFPKENSEDFKESLVKDNVSFLQIPLHRLTKERKSLIKYIITFWKEVFDIKRIIKSENIDIVHANGAWQIKGIIAAGLSKVPSVWHMNDSYQPGPVEKLFTLFSGKANFYIYAASKTKKYYQSVSPKIQKHPYALIQAPVDTNKFVPGQKTNSLDGDGVKLISVGYVNANKGFETLLHAMGELKDSNTKYQLYIVGTIFDSQQSYYQKLLDVVNKYDLSNVHFMGYRSDVSDLLHAADIYVCSSDFEASPIAVWEALSSGIPVVSTDVGDVKEIFNMHECGSVVPTQNPSLLAEAIEKLAVNNEMQDLYSQNGRKTAELIFSLDSVVKAHVDSYQQTVNNFANSGNL